MEQTIDFPMTISNFQMEANDGVIPYKKLGNTGFDVSQIGFGTWQIGGGRWKGESTIDSVRMLEEASDKGINIFDAAVVYGQYQDSNGELQSRSQELLGQAFQHKRDSVYLCIKLGQFDEISHRSFYDPARVVEQFKQSLRRLKTDYVDIALIHAPPIHAVRDGVALSILQTLQALGLVRAIGYSFENEPEHAKLALGQRVDVLMLQYNLIDQQCKNILIDAEERGVGILVGGPLKRGYLSGKYFQSKDLPMDDDYWRWNIQKNPHKVRSILAKVQNLSDTYGRGEDLRRSALRFVLQAPGVSSAIVGHRSIAECVGNLQAVA